MLVAALLVQALVLALGAPAARAQEDEFPKDFLFGSATASYQVEGGWNASGKGENIWDHLTHLHPEVILDGSSGDIACDSYNKYKEDVQLLKNIGFNVYRFSLSWSRILPTGAVDKINEAGIQYYDDLINELLTYNIQPMVTLFHWDLPQPLMDLGGWPNRVLVDYFRDFAELAFDRFGDRVKLWLTFNEPVSICSEGWGDATKAPMIKLPAWADYQCGHTVLLAHAEAYHLYNDKFRTSQGGKVAITLNSDFMQPKDASSKDDVDATERAQNFLLGWFANPIFSAEGDYPKVMREYIEAKSTNLENLPRSRLPKFTEAEIKLLKGSSDFFGINHYTTNEVSYVPPASPYVRSLDADGEFSRGFNDAWEKVIATWMRVTPWGIRGLMNWVKKTYVAVPIIITENGCPDVGQLKDVQRTNFYRGYLNALLKAKLEDGVNIFGYVAWSLMDNFEWLYGYEHHFGITKVDFNDPNRKRTPKMSSKFFQQVIATRKVPDTDPDFPDDGTTPSPTTAQPSTAHPTTMRPSTASPATAAPSTSGAPASSASIGAVVLCCVLAGMRIACRL